MSLKLGCALLLGVIILAAVVLCIWIMPSRKVAPPKPSPVIVTKPDDQIVPDSLTVNTIHMVKEPLNVGYPATDQKYRGFADVGQQYWIVKVDASL